MKTKKTRLLGLILVAALLVSALPMAGLTASAAKMEGAFFKYGTPAFAYVITGLKPERSDDTVKLYQNADMASYAGYTDTYTIPARAYDSRELQFYTVTEISGAETSAPGALENVPLKGIILPNTVTTIGARAFANSGLKEITFPTSVTDLAADAFSGVTLTKLSLDVVTATTLVSSSAYNSTRGTLITLPAPISELNVSAPLTVSGAVTVPGTTTVTNTGVTIPSGGSLTLNGALSGAGVLEVRSGGSLTLNANSPAFTGSIRLTGDTAAFKNGTSSPVSVQNAAGKTVSVLPGEELQGRQDSAQDNGEEEPQPVELPKITFNEGGTVTVDDTGTIVTILPAEGYQVASVVINGLQMGEITRYVFPSASASNTVAVTFIEGEKPEGPVQPVVTPTQFLDVSETASYAGAVQFLANNGIFYGVGKNLFAPDQLTSRAMYVTLLKRMEIYGVNFSVAMPKNASVDDAAVKRWYTEAVVWATGNGIVDGSVDSFLPNQSITREEAAVLLARYTRIRGYSTRTDAGRYNVYRDSLLLEGEARQAMVWAATKGYLHVQNSVLDPSGTLTRAEVAEMLARYLKVN